MANTKSIDLELSSSQYLSITDAAQTGLDITGDISFICWIKAESQPVGVLAPLNRQEVFSKWSGSGDGERAYHLSNFYRDATSKYELQFNTSDDGADADAVLISSSSPLLPTGTWIHLAVTKKMSTSTVNFYINGVQTGGPLVAPKGQTSILNSSFPFVLGALEPGTGVTNFFDGKMDEVGVYNAELSAATILADYNSGNGTERSSGESNIVAGWRFEDDLLDVTSNNNDLTNNNSAVFSTDVPFEGGVAAVDDTMFFGCNF